MIPSETMGINYFYPDNNTTSPLPHDLTFIHNNNNNNNTFNLTKFFANLSSSSSSLSLSSPSSFVLPTMHVAAASHQEQQQRELGIMVDEERRRRRMISNRESARRSRMRKQRHLDELWSHVMQLRAQNHNLLDRLNEASERHEEVLQENARLKEDASKLRQRIMQFM